MDVKVNYIAVLLSAISLMMIGAIWYAPKVFGDIWAKEVGLSTEQLKQGNVKAILTTVVGALIKAFVLAQFIYISNIFFDNSFLQDALLTALYVWVGFFITATTMRNTFERASNKLTYLSVGYDFVTLMLMGLIIGLIGI